VCVVQDGSIVYANRWLREIGGYPAGDDAPREALSLFHPDDRALVSRRLQLHLAGQDAGVGSVVRLVTREGGVHEAEFHCRSIEHRGRPAVQATLIDVGARVEAERGLQADATRLEVSNRSRQLFGDIISHDLMNPVWIAENYLRLVMDGGVPEEKRTFYEGMRGALAKARGILADARTYLRIQDLVAFGGERTDLGQVAEAVAQSHRPLGELKGQTITVTSVGRTEIAGSLLISEAVSQLLSNAVKFGPPDSAIEVSVSGGERVLLGVRDRGAGVQEAGRERIFQRFERMEKGPIAGIGLGLTIVRRIVDLHGGRVWAEDNPGGGSVFFAEFPAAD
jgi:PAS domain S-box-containing protein